MACALFDERSPAALGDRSLLRRTPSYSLAMESQVLPPTPLPVHPTSFISPSLPPALIPLLPSFPILTSHNLHSSLPPRPLFSFPSNTRSNTCTLPSSQAHRDHPTHKHTPSQLSLSLSLTLLAADVNYPTTAAEIIELLHKNVCFLSGGRAREGQSLFTFPAKDKNFEYNRDDLRRVIQYLASIPM